MTHPFLGLGFYTWSEKFSRNITNTEPELQDINYTITNTGGDFVLRSNGTVNYTVNWGDGNSESSTSNALTHTYTAGDYTITIDSDDAYYPYFANISSDSEQITSVTIGADANLGTNIQYAWRSANNMTSFVCPFDVTSNITDIRRTWQSCSSLPSFPLIDTSSVILANSAWFGCSSLTSFPLLDTSSVTYFQSTWWNCTNLTSFPLIDTSSGINFQYTWKDCSNLTSFPSIDTSSVQIMSYAWNGCSSLTSFPVIDLSGAINLNISSTWNGCTSLTTFPVLDYSNVLYCFNTWLNCALSVQSIENILVALDTAGKSNVSTSVSGGTSAAKTTWSAAANTAYANLISKGWTVAHNP
tara:strand:- start:452 stop:1519 length:1068 start_codon:yes stop_codon:yes gene_type:complete